MRDITTIDGYFMICRNWVHLRKSNTEPIIRIYTEAATQQKADELVERIIDEIKVIAGVFNQ
jgi:phosphomannomutase